MTRRPRLRRIIHQLTESGTARLIFDENCYTIQGVLINSTQDSFSIYGKLKDPSTSLDEKLKMPSTSEHEMQITIVDGESGETYNIENATAYISEFVNPIRPISHLVVNIDHPAIKFETKEVVIGNRADIVISQYIDPKLLPSVQKKVLIGTMSLKLIAKEKSRVPRRVSESVNMFGSDVIEKTRDFFA